ncbi:RNA recognition motif domain [Perkinsela sp. CCAP 1560/4]|nr:RNA recognition motif domain [Perkinsela sp. CCAP 1560/4]|eukprot:KNH09617.1 RNA recognition motif domain [Perkinsela sp. CCAP 1560/4]
MTEKALEKYASQFGAVKNLVISRSPSTGGSRGYGFIEFDTAEVAATAARELHGCFLHNKCLVAQVQTNLHGNIFTRTDQVRRIKCDMARRLHGYISPVKESCRKNKEEVQQALKKMIELETVLNAKNQKLGIEYVFSGFSAQKKVL